MMDVTITSVARLWEQQCSQKEIARRLHISEQKVRKILITIGAKETDISRMYAGGASIADIAQKTGLSRAAVLTNIPYIKGIYAAEYPTINALRIRKCRNRNNE